MSGVRYRRRGTAIVETQRGILLTAGRRGKPSILPSGGAKRGESRFMAALRELTEETGLLPYAAEIIFRHKGKIRPTMSGRHKFQDQHTVCLVKASGTPRPGGLTITKTQGITLLQIYSLFVCNVHSAIPLSGAWQQP